MTVGLELVDVFCRLRWRYGINRITIKLRLIWPPSFVGLLPVIFVGIKRMVILKLIV